MSQNCIERQLEPIAAVRATKSSREQLETDGAEPQEALNIDSGSAWQPVDLRYE